MGERGYTVSGTSAPHLEGQLARVDNDNLPGGGNREGQNKPHYKDEHEGAAPPFPAPACVTHLLGGLARARAEGLDLGHDVHRAVVEDLAKHNVAVWEKHKAEGGGVMRGQPPGPGACRCPALADALSSHEVLTVVMKNCEPLVLGPALAMDRMPGPVCSKEGGGEKKTGVGGKAMRKRVGTRVDLSCAPPAAAALCFLQPKTYSA